MEELDAFLGELPILLLTLVGGVVADRWDRRRVLLVSQCVQLSTAFALAALVYWPPMQGPFGTSPVPLAYWPFVFVWTPALPLVDEACKALRRRRARRPRQSNGARPRRKTGVLPAGGLRPSRPPVVKLP